MNERFKQQIMCACFYVDISKKIFKNHYYIVAGIMEVSDNDQIEKIYILKKNSIALTFVSPCSPTRTDRNVIG